VRDFVASLDCEEGALELGVLSLQIRKVIRSACNVEIGSDPLATEIFRAMSELTGAVVRSKKGDVIEKHSLRSALLILPWGGKDSRKSIATALGQSSMLRLCLFDVSRECFMIYLTFVVTFGGNSLEF
jgi:hypothetical protein